MILRTETIVLYCAFALYSFLSKRSHAFNACTNGISTTDELSFFENIEPCICNKNGSIWYTHVEIDGVSVLTHDRNILNPFSERFNKRYLVNAVDCSIVRDDILSTIACTWRLRVFPIVKVHTRLGAMSRCNMVGAMS